MFKKSKKIISLIFFIALTLLFTACSTSNTDISNNEFEKYKKEDQLNTLDNTKSNNDNIIKVHFIDVGQADSILIQDSNNNTILIDAGNNDDSDLVVNYIKSQDIDTINYIVGTHPHEDHIGGLDSVIDNFDIGKVILPKATSTTKTYKDVLLSIKNKKLSITPAIAGKSFFLGDAKCEILAPNNSEYDDLNNYSVVIKLTYKNNSFLFTGDCEDVSEEEMLSLGYNLKSDLLKVGHHGSNSSTSLSFLKSVSPKYAIISVGKNNKYNHPTQETLDKLNSQNVNIYRTDELGNIIATSDGDNIVINKASPINSTSIDTTQYVYITKTGKRYHKKNCSFLKSTTIPISLKEAQKSYTPCSKCDI
ncbi:ComEC/Rec2 family competence protein [Tepidibacter mesophilus]|uniref:ComEC/Rec2 family competence protein n=1 Tax=Tepidibacter mesophilus TaxID=655607 RepID=UPI000C08BACA|nr:ComEC/Rec2 family competence protein [Tepidibacter mesophilus]